MYIGHIVPQFEKETRVKSARAFLGERKGYPYVPCVEARIACLFALLSHPSHRRACAVKPH